MSNIETKAVVTNAGELNENELGNVSGGILLSTALGAVGVMALAGGEMAFITSYAVKQYKNWKKKR